MQINIDSAQRALLRATAHSLNPVAMIGADGLTPAVLREIDVHLAAHELIKIRVFDDDRSQRAAFMDRICGALKAAPVQQIGKLLVIWRPQPKKPRAVAAKRANTGREVKVVTPSRSGRRPSVKKLTVLSHQRVTAGGTVKRAKPRQKSVKKQSSGD